MSLPTMSQFLEGLSDSRLLDRSQIEQLLLRPETPRGDIDGAFRFLQSNGWLTQFQFNEIIAGRANSLFFASYRILDLLEETPAGKRYKVYHPALLKPVSLTLLKPDWTDPADSLSSYLERLQKVSSVSHTNLVNVLDAGTLQGLPFVLEELVDGTDLGYFVNDMGALPAQLAIDFMRQACLGLQSIHDAGVSHGDLHPGQLLLTPVIRQPQPGGRVAIRPGPGAIVKIRGAAFTPVRPAIDELSLKQFQFLPTIDFIASERLNSGVPTHRGDVYALGATIYFLLAGRPPVRSTNEREAIWNMQYGRVTPVGGIRSDIPAPVERLLNRMISRNPADRPSSFFEVLTQMQSSSWDIPKPSTPEKTVLIPQASETNSFPSSLRDVMQEHNAAPTPFPVAFPATVSSFPAQAPLPEYTPPLPPPTVEPMDSSHRLGDPWQPRQLSELTPAPQSEPQDLFTAVDSTEDRNYVPKARRAQPKKPTPWGWIILGLLLHITGAILLIGLLAGWFR